MSRITTLTFVLAIGVAAAFAVPTENNPSFSAEKAAEVVTADDDVQCRHLASLENNGSQSPTSQKKMKGNTLRWFIRGVVSELYHNVVLRQMKRLRQKISPESGHLCRQQPKKEIAIVTGATGGIGSHMVSFNH